MAQVNGGGQDHVQQENKGFDFQGSLAELTSPPKFDSVEAERAYLKERLAGAIRIVGRLGLDHHIAGHLTVRDPENPHNFWVNPFGLSMSIMTVSDLILVNQEGKVIGGGKPGRRIVNLAGFLIHSAIHKVRPDVNAIVHSHSIYGKAFSTLGEELPITTQDACAFYSDIALLNQFGGVVVSGGEGDLIGKTLGQKSSIILQNHGLLTTGQTIDSALARFILLDAQCQVALLSKAAGQPVLVDEAQAVFTHKEVGSERAFYFQASPYFQHLDHDVGDAYKK